MDIHQLIIIGSGPAGLTAAIYAARANLHPIVIEGDKPGGQLMGTSVVENWPGNKSIMGPELMMNMRDHAQSLGAQFVSGMVVAVEGSQAPFKITTSADKSFMTRAIIVATGASPKKLKVAGEQEYWGKGVTVCAVCDASFYKDKKVIVVGGGDTACEEASFLTKFTDQVTMVHILDELTASPAMRERVIDNPAINIIYSTTVAQIKGNGERVTHVVLTNQKNNESYEVEADGLFVAIGYTPNSSIFKSLLDVDEYGYIKITDQTHSSVKGIFVAGDVADYRYRQAITSAGAGCMAALDAQKYLN